MTDFKSTIENSPSSQEICELNLWSPPQGSIKEAVPISVDLDFSKEQVILQSSRFYVSSSRAKIYLKIIDAELVRGSRLGEYVHDPNMVGEVTQSVRSSMENELEASGKLEVTVGPKFFNTLTGFVRWRKRASKTSERDHLVNTTVKVSRISPRPKLKWDVVEPISPCILNGRYLGLAGGVEIGPLCLLTMRKDACVVEVKIAVKRQDIVVTDMQVSRGYVGSRNKEAVLHQIIRRCLISDQLASPGISVNLENDSILMCSSKIRIEIESK